MALGHRPTFLWRNDNDDDGDDGDDGQLKPVGMLMRRGIPRFSPALWVEYFPARREKKAGLANRRAGRTQRVSC